MKKFLIILLLIIGFLLRLYKINNPITDWHSFRQVDTASVTRNIKNGTGSFFVPTYHDLSDLQTGKENPHGYRLVEIPIYNQISAFFANFFPLEISSRLVAILFSLASSFLIYLLVFSWTKNYWASIFSMATFLFLPFNIYYSRTILPEPTAVFFMLLSLYLFPKYFYFSALALALSILVKPYTALLLFPFYFYYAKKFNKKTNFIFGLIAFLPFILWRLWINHFPTGVPASAWLFNEGNMRFHPAWWRWLFFERLGKMILGVFGVIPFYLGFFYKKNKTQTNSVLLSLGILLYFSVIARGNIQHDYYQVLTIPFISIISGFGLYYMYKYLSSYSTIIIFLFAIAFSWYQIKDYYIINKDIVTTGQIADQILPKDAWVLAPRNGDTTFIYQINRPGWPIEIYDVPALLNRYPNHKIYFVTVDNNDYASKLKSIYPAIINTDKLTILDLNKI